jgi:transporter family-2 protein
MIASVMIDHLGLIRVPIHALSVPRVLGAVLIIGGVVLVQRF